MSTDTCPSVSLDFDGTLSRPGVQEYAAELIRRRVNVWVLTARFDENHRHRYAANPSNADLWTVVDRIGIPRCHVRFQNMRPKAEYLDWSRFVWHLDDDEIELSAILYSGCCDVIGISVLSPNWVAQCEGLLTRLYPPEIDH